MVNHHRGEIEAELNGKTYCLCLTLGALAELEAAFGDDDMLALVGRFESGRLSAMDIQRIIAAGLRGGGNAIDDEIIAQMRVKGGAAGFISIVSRLLKATFAGDEVNGADDVPGNAAAEDAQSTVPFPGMR